MWLAREEDGSLKIFLYANKVVYDEVYWIGWEFDEKGLPTLDSGNWLSSKELFPEVTFENSPIEVELIPKDSLAKQLELEYKRGICEGENYPIWHLYPEKKPDDTSLYIVTVLFHNKTLCTVAEYNKTKEEWLPCGCRPKPNVIAWMELPNPIKKDEIY